MATSHRKGAGFAEIPSKAFCRIGKNANFPKIPLTFSCKNRIIKLCIVVREEGIWPTADSRQIRISGQPQRFCMKYSGRFLTSAPKVRESWNHFTTCPAACPTDVNCRQAVSIWSFSNSWETQKNHTAKKVAFRGQPENVRGGESEVCLLYTSDAADD